MNKLETLSEEVEKQIAILKECYRHIEELLNENPQIKTLSFKLDLINDDSDHITYISELEVNGDITTFEDDDFDDYMDEYGDLSISIPVGMIGDNLKIIYESQCGIEITLKE